MCRDTLYLKVSLQLGPGCGAGPAGASVGVALFLKPVHPVSLGHGWVCSPGGSLVSEATCSLPPPPLPSGFHCKKARTQVLPPPLELPESGARSPLTPPQRNTVYQFPKNATMLCVMLGGFLYDQCIPQTVEYIEDQATGRALQSQPPSTTFVTDFECILATDCGLNWLDACTSIPKKYTTFHPSSPTIHQRQCRPQNTTQHAWDPQERCLGSCKPGEPTTKGFGARSPTDTSLPS